MKKIKLCAIILASLVGVLVIAGIIIINIVDINRYKPMIERVISETVGRKVTIERDIHLLLTLNPTVKIDNVLVANPKWASSPNMIEIKEVEVSFSLPDLLLAKLKISEVNIDGVKAFLEVSKNGEENWDFSNSNIKDADKTASKEMEKVIEEGGFSLSYELGDISINDVFIAYNNLEEGSKKSFELKKLRLGSDGKLDLKAKIEGKDLVVTGNLGHLNRALNGKAPLMVNIDAIYDKNTLVAKGEIANLTDLSGIDMSFDANGSALDVVGKYEVSAKLSGSMQALQIKDVKARAGIKNDSDFKLSGSIKNVNKMEGVDLQLFVDAFNPQYLGVKPFKLTLNIDDMSGTGVAAGDVMWTAGKSSVKGELRLDFSKKIPYIKANLRSDYFTFRDIKSDAKTEISQKETSKNTDTTKDEGLFVFSDERLPFAELGKLNADIDVNFKDIRIKEDKSVRTVINARLKDAVLKAKLNTSSGKTSKVVADLSVNAKTKASAEIALNANVKGVVVSDWLYLVWGDQLQGGDAEMSITAKTYGDSMHTLMAHLNADVELLVENMKFAGQLKKFMRGELASAIFGSFKSNKSDDADLDVQCVAAKLDFEDGESSFERKVALESSRGFITVSGDLNMGTEKMDLSFNMTSISGSSTSLSNMIASLVKVNGTFMEPKVSVNPMGVVATAGTIGAAVMTGGLSYLGQRILGAVDDMSASTSPCADALGREVKSSMSYKKAHEKKETEKASGDATNKSNNGSVIKDIEKKTGDLFNGLKKAVTTDGKK